MHYIPFNSRKPYHKFPFGAIDSEGEVTFRVILPRELQCRAVWLVIHRDDRHEWQYRPFSWLRMEGDGEEWWQTSFKPGESGLFWYHFEYDTDWGRMKINCVGCGIGKITNDGCDWQLTVYDKAFQTPDWIKGGVIYQIFPDRFNSSGKKKKNVPADRVLRSDWGGTPMWEPDKDGKITKYDFFGGDLEGIREKLDYIAGLGVNCIYLNPIFEAQSNHRYDTADYTRIDPLLGTKSDFKRLCADAESKGIRIVLDGVFSHTGADSIYFNKYGRYGDGGAYNSKQSDYFSWYKFRRWPNEYVSWWGIDILPEVIEENESYLDYIAGKGGVIENWMSCGAYGWRLDVADELPDVLLDRIYEAVKRKNPQAYLLGEVWEDATNKYSYGERRRYLLGGQLDSVMNYPFADAVLGFMKNGSAESFMEKIVSVTENYPKPSLDVLMNHIGTHDTVRALTLLSRKGTSERFAWRSNDLVSDDFLDAGKQLLKSAAVLQFTLPGVPCIYYGDEAALQGGADPYNRRCYPWGNEDSELLNFYRALGALRNGRQCLKDGIFCPVSSALGCVAFERVSDSGKVLVIVNRNEHEIYYGLPCEWHNTEIIFGGNGRSTDCVYVGGISAVILEIRKDGTE